MGLEVAALVAGGLSVAKAAGDISNARSQAKATVAEGNIALKNKGRQISLAAATAKNSFLTSGLMLEGTPQASIGGIFDTGLEDMDQLSSNYNQKSKNIISAGRTAALGDIGNAFSAAALPGLSGGSGLEFDGAMGGVDQFNGQTINWNGYGGFY